MSQTALKYTPDILPDIWYHCTCRSILTVKKDLQRIEKEKQPADSEGTSSQLTPKRSIRRSKNELFLPRKCLICSKVRFIRGTRNPEKLILCTDLRSDQTLKMGSKHKTDERIIAACSDELIAKEVNYHRTCY